MNTSSDSDRQEGDSLADQIQEQVLKFNKIKRGGHHRGSRSNHPEDELYRQALRQFMFGKFQIAAQNCKKIIANHPENPEPYFLMANMHQQAGKKRGDIGELHKAVQFYFFHAYYSQPSIQKWLKTADLSFDLEIYLQAAYCYGRALKINNRNIDINLKRAQALQRCQQTKKAINIYKKIIQRVNASLQVYKRYAKLRFRRKQYSKAREILLSYEGYQNDINLKYMICQTYLKQKKYIQLEAFMKKTVLLSSQKQQQENQIEQQLSESAQQPLILADLDDLLIQFVIMLYICRLLSQFQNQSQKQNEKIVYSQQIQNCYKQKYSETSIRTYILKNYSEKYNRMKDIRSGKNMHEKQQLQQVIQQYNQLPQIYQQMLTQLCNNQQLDHSYVFNLLQQLIKYPAHQNVKNYLILSQSYKKSGQISQAMKILKQALKGQCKQSVQIKMQMNHMKTLKNIKSSKQKKDKKIKKNKMNQRFNLLDDIANQDLYFSDEQINNQQKNRKQKNRKQKVYYELEDNQMGESIKSSSQSYQEQSQSESDSDYNNQEQAQLQNNKKTNKTKQIAKNSKQTNSLEDSINQKLLNNTKATLQQIMSAFSQQYQQIDIIISEDDIEKVMGSYDEANLLKIIKQNYHKIRQCLEYLINLQKNNDNQMHNQAMEGRQRDNWKNRTGIFSKNNKRRRNISHAHSRITRSHFIRQHSNVIAQCLKIILNYVKKCIITSQYQYILTFTQMLSKSKFFSWHNRNIQFRRLKVQIYQVGVLACLNLHKFQKALFFCRFLINRYPTNNFYLNLVSFIMKMNQENGQKVSLNAMVNKGGVIDNIIHNSHKNSQNIKYVELQYLLGIQYMQNSFFELAIGMFLKVIQSIKGSQNQLLSNCYLAISTCFIQIASSRTVFNKMDNVNRSAFAFKQYQDCIKKQFQNKDTEIKHISEFQCLFNLGRWYIYVKLYHKSVQCFNKLMKQIIQHKSQFSEDKYKIVNEIQLKTAYNLIIIYRDAEQYDKANQISTKYFMI